MCIRDSPRAEQSKGAKQALRTLTGPQFRVRLPICAEVLRRALCLHRWANKHRHVAADHHSSLHDLFTAAIEIVTDVTTVADEFLDALRLTREDVAAHGWADVGWAEISVRKFCEVEAFLFEETLRAALQFHMSIVSEIASHLKLVFEDVFRASRLGGAMLSPKAAGAQRAARDLRDKLISTRAAAMTTFDKAFPTTAAWRCSRPSLTRNRRRAVA